MIFDSPAPYRRESIGRATLVAVPAAAEWARAAIREAGTLFDFAARHPGAEPLEGRGVLYRVPAPDGPCVVRHYRRGGAVARVLDDRYLRVGRPRPVRELRASRAVRARGLDSPEVVALAVYPAGLFYRADIATRYIPESADLATVLFGDDGAGTHDSGEACAAAGGVLRRAHERGVLHADLNLKNILLAWSERPPRPYLLDLDRCRVDGRVSERARKAMLARFERSWRKWERRTGRATEDGEWDAFLAGYRTGADE